jgi:hypothetical protein
MHYIACRMDPYGFQESIEKVRNMLDMEKMHCKRNSGSCCHLELGSILAAKYGTNSGAEGMMNNPAV